MTIRTVTILLSLIVITSCGGNSRSSHSGNAANTRSVAAEAGGTDVIPEQAVSIDSLVMERLRKLDPQARLHRVSDGGRMIAGLFGVEWGVNTYAGDGRISRMTLITSNNDSRIFRRALKILAGSLGEPWSVEEDQERASWYDDDIDATLRHLHTEEGGWTFYISYRE